MTVNPYAAKIKTLNDAIALAEAYSKPATAWDLRALEYRLVQNSQDWDDVNL